MSDDERDSVSSTFQGVQSGNQRRETLRGRLEACPQDLRAGLELAEIEEESQNPVAAVEVLAALWRATRDPEAADRLARLSVEHMRRLEENVRRDTGVIERLAGLLRALHGPDSIVVDTLQYDIIGGLALDTTTLVPVHKAGLTRREGKNTVFFSGKSANPALVEMIGREIPLFRDETFGKLMPYCAYDWKAHRFTLNERFVRDFWGGHERLFDDLVAFTHSTNGRDYFRSEADADICRKAKKPQIRFSEAERRVGDAFLRDVLGVGPDGWFVCAYARDGVYYNETPDSPNWFRNADIGAFSRAVDTILKRGGHVVRVGEVTGRNFEHPDPRVVDYSNRGLRTPFLDIYLLAKCRFFMGTPSGLTHVCEIFATPELLVDTINVNMVPSASLYIPKLIRDVRTRELVPYDEFLRRFFAHGDVGALFENGVKQRELLHVEYEDNSPEDIDAAVREMLARLDGTHDETPASSRLRGRVRDMWLRRHPVMADVVLASSFLERHGDLF